MSGDWGLKRGVVGLAAVLTTAMLVPAQAVDFSDMMNPGRWIGGAQDRGYDRYDPGFGVPGYYGQQPYYGPERYTQPQFGQQPFGYAPYGQQPFGQPGVPQYGADPGWSVETDPRFPGSDPSAWSHREMTPSYEVPDLRYERHREPDHRLEQRVRDLEHRVEELERRQRDGRRESPREFPQPEYPPLR